jgi:hypothetical protein
MAIRDSRWPVSIAGRTPSIDEPEGKSGGVFFLFAAFSAQALSCRQTIDHPHDAAGRSTNPVAGNKKNYEINHSKTRGTDRGAAHFDYG